MFFPVSVIIIKFQRGKTFKHLFHNDVRMGGKALKNVSVSRINLQELDFIQNDIFNKLQEYIDITFPIQNPDKKDFGDVDILYSHKKDNFVLSDHIKELYKPIEVVNNGDVLSFSYNYSVIKIIFNANF